MKQYSVLIVDDSAFMRKTIGSIIEANTEMFVVGKARNGIDAMEKIKRFKPDLVTLDIEMPEMDGMETLKQIMHLHPTPVVMLSNGEASILDCFEQGAVDFVIKHELIQQKNDAHREDFHRRLIAAASAKIPTIVQEQKNIEKYRDETKLKGNLEQTSKRLIVIGSSTGGPSALQQILTRFKSDFPIPILVVQHMPPGFTKHLADRFHGLCQLRVKEAEHNELLQPGTIYIAPSGLQTTLKINELGQLVVCLKITSSIDTLYKPSVDVTLLSLAHKLKDKLLVAILTGMGDDGLRGCIDVKLNKGYIISESEESCVVYGMPKVVFEAGVINKQIPLELIYDEIIQNTR